MSRAVRLALVAEGPTDAIVVQAALRSILADRPFTLTQLQPEASLAFGPRGTGWGGVYKWCKQVSAQAGGHLSQFGPLEHFDVLILQLDADVADEEYAAAGIVPDPQDGHLPCAQPCPPVEDTTKQLRAVLLSWCGEAAIPPRTVLCTPSKSTDAWMVAALFPDDAAVRAIAPFECHAGPSGRLAQQPKTRRIRKAQSDYRDAASTLTEKWPDLDMVEVRRFQVEVLAALPQDDVAKA